MPIRPFRRGGDMWRRIYDPNIDGMIAGPQIEPLTITGGRIADGAVTTPKIADLNITEPKIGNDAVIMRTIAWNAINSDRLVDGAVTTAKIVDGAVNTPKILDGAVNTPKILDGAVNTLKILDSAINTAKLLDYCVTVPKMAFGTAIRIDDFTQTVTGTTLPVISGLNLDHDRIYHLYLNIHNLNTTTAAPIRLIYNGDTLMSNYWNQRIQSDGTTVTGVRTNDAQIGALPHEMEDNFMIIIQKRPGRRPTAITLQSFETPSLIRTSHTVMKWMGTANVTSIQIVTPTTSGIGIGSTHRLFFMG